MVATSDPGDGVVDDALEHTVEIDPQIELVELG